MDKLKPGPRDLTVTSRHGDKVADAPYHLWLVVA